MPCINGMALRDYFSGEASAASPTVARVEEFRGKSVLISTSDQLSAARALIQLDGVARRMVLCTPDAPLEHLAAITESAEVDAIVSDQGALGPNYPAIASCETEWILLTSGTTGVPKLVVHTLQSLAHAISQGAPINPGATQASPVVWSTFYDIRRYGGLQIFLRAVLTGASLVLSDSHESPAEFLERAGARGVTHISGTPSHWRRALMSPAAKQIDPEYIRLSGEIADQTILNHLKSFYPKTKLSHAFASTEAGVAFEVNDGLAGFPAGLVGQKSGVEMQVRDGSLRIRSPRIARRYLGHMTKPLVDADGFVDTGDVVKLHGDRYHFAGRRDGVINVGGQKVHPEEVEAVINGHPDVRMSVVRTRRNPITGALVVADVVLKAATERTHQNDILAHCRKTLPAHKVPAIINFVPALAIAETGKLLRHA
jgi:acyl-coenzyme A synthetase/AMP-(fatty) acid ligase